MLFFFMWTTIHYCNKVLWSKMCIWAVQEYYVTFVLSRMLRSFFGGSDLSPFWVWKCGWLGTFDWLEEWIVYWIKLEVIKITEQWFGLKCVISEKNVRETIKIFFIFYNFCMKSIFIMNNYTITLKSLEKTHVDLNVFPAKKIKQ